MICSDFLIQIVLFLSLQDFFFVKLDPTMNILYTYNL